jgi:hypothetical protein
MGISADARRNSTLNSRCLAGGNSGLWRTPHISLIAATLVAAVAIAAAQDAHQLRLGHYVVFVPQSLAASRGYHIITPQNKFLDAPPEQQIDANQLIISMAGIAALGLNNGVDVPPKPPSPYVEWKTKHQIPAQIKLSFGNPFGDWSVRMPFAVEQNRKMVAAASALEPDLNGFVRVNRNFLVYRGSSYQTEAGDTLVVYLPPPFDAGSYVLHTGSVSIALKNDLHLTYLFYTRDSSTVELWQMHQQVVSCIERLLQPPASSPC